MKYELLSIIALQVNTFLSQMSGDELRAEVSAWVTLFGQIAITVTTIGIQVYRLIKDRDKKDPKNKDKGDDKKDG